MREAIRMRVEQLCRFRTDTVGYEVFAKSEGITSANVANHAKFFTQGMDPLFRNGGALETGRSIMTYTGTGDDFFIGARLRFAQIGVDVADRQCVADGFVRLCLLCQRTVVRFERTRIVLDFGRRHKVKPGAVNIALRLLAVGSDAVPHKLVRAGARDTLYTEGKGSVLDRALMSE